MLQKSKQTLVFFVVLASVNFFNPFGLFNFTLSKVIFSLFCLYCIATCNFVSIDKKSLMLKSQVMIIVGMLISYIVCDLYNDQSFFTSLKSCFHFLLAYIFLFVLVGYKIADDKILQIVKIICILSMIVYIINFLTFPSVIFGTSKEEYDLSRGMVRLGVPCIELFVLYFLYNINQYQIKRNKIYLGYIIICLLFIVLSLTRQVIVYSIVLGTILYFKSISIWRKVIFVLLCLIVVQYVVPNLDVFQSMQELTVEQIERNNNGYENIRLIAWDWFTNELQSNDITRILGNGYPVEEGSAWGNKVLRSSKMMLCYPTDVGWATFYFYYGAVTTFFLALVLFNAILLKKTQSGSYLSYWIIYVILSSFTSGLILYPNQIISITLVLYLVHSDNQKYKNQKLQFV